MSNKMKIERGIIIADQYSDVKVSTVGCVYPLNLSSMIDRTYYVNQKLFGVILENKYCICHELRLKSGERYFGYILNNTFNCTAFRFQLILDFKQQDHIGFNLIKKYSLGEQILLKKENILDFDDE
jgi:hypothetical protein